MLEQHDQDNSHNKAVADNRAQEGGDDVHRDNAEDERNHNRQTHDKAVVEAVSRAALDKSVERRGNVGAHQVEQNNAYDGAGDGRRDCYQLRHKSTNHKP